MTRSLLTFILISPLLLVAQKNAEEKQTSELVSQPDRLEFLINNNADFTLVNGESDGFMVIEETGKRAAGNQYIWNLNLIDTAFNSVDRKQITFPIFAQLGGFDYSNGIFYLLFFKNSYAREELTILSYEVKTQSYTLFETTTVFPISLQFFESLNEHIIIGGETNGRPVIVRYSTIDKVPIVIPGFYDNKSKMLDVIIDDKSNLFSVVLSERMRNRRSTIRVKTFTAEGDLVQDNLINPGERKSLLDASTTNFSGGLQYLAGTQTRKSTTYSQGLYLAKFVNGQQKALKYFPFAELDNFFGYLPEKREERIRNRIERKKENGKIKRFSYRLVVHEIIEHQDEYIMIAEAYYPRYRYPSSYGAASQPVFLGYKYTHAVVIGFDNNCNINWDNTFRIDDTEEFFLRENVTVSIDDRKVLLTYLEENEIRTKVISGNEIVEGKTYNPIRLTFEQDELRQKEGILEGLERFYENTLIAYGEQSIANKSRATGEERRRVFYINKIRFNSENYPN